MSIVNNNYNRFNIGKLPRNRYSSNGSSSMTILNGGSSSSSSSTANLEGHYLWGNYFDGTQDIVGTLSNVQDIHMDGDIEIGGDIEIEGTIGIGASGMITGPNAYFAEATIDSLTGGSAGFNDLTSNTAEISTLSTNNIYNSQNITTGNIDVSGAITAAYGDIATLRSQDIRTKNLTVDGTAHFFELVIDKIKSTGGNIILTPADGFKIEATYDPSPTQKILYFLAEDDDNKITNMWEVGDQAIIKNFNKAVSGTSYNVDNTYYWGDVVGVSTQAGPKSPTDDGRLYHYIVVSKVSGAYDGSTNGIEVGNEVVMLGHKQRANEEEADAKKRQNAIYMSAYTPVSGTGGYDEDLISPSLVYYEGIKTFELAPYKKQWWSSGVTTIGQQRNIPQNKMVGSFTLQAGKTIEQYIDENIKDANISMFSFDAGSNLWMVQCNSDYSISTEQMAQTWATNIELLKNGSHWNLTNNYDIQVYAVNGSTETQLSTGYTITPLDANGKPISPTDTQAAKSFNVSLDSLSTVTQGSWYGNNSKTVRLKFGTYDDDNNHIYLKYDIQLIKLPKGENGSAASVDLDEYSLFPSEELCYVDAAGAMKVVLLYSLKRVHVDADGNTIVNTGTNISGTQFSAVFSDDAIKYDNPISTQTIGTTEYFRLYLDDYFAGTGYANYLEAMADDAAPTFITVQLRNAGAVIDSRIVPVQFLAGSVFQITDEKFEYAVARSLTGSANYTDSQINTVSNNITTLTADVNGIRGRVGTLETNYDDMNEVVSTKADVSYVDQTATGITNVVESKTTTLQNNINNVNTKADNISNNLNSNYLTTVAVRSEIAQSATAIYMNVSEEINGELTETGIDIENRKITINSDNTNFLGNINLYNPNEGLILYDDDGNATAGIINANVTNNTNYFNIKSDAKTEQKSSSDTFTYTHNIELGTYGAGDYIDVYYLGARLSKNSDRIIPRAGTYTYNLKRGTTSVLTGSGSFEVDIYNNLFAEQVVSQYRSTTLGTYNIELSITYTTNAQQSGQLTSNINFYCSTRDVTNIQMIGNDGVNFKTGEHRQFVVGNNIVCQNGIGNELVLDDRKISKRAINYNSDTHVGLLGEISSTYPYREITGNYTATADDAIIYINGAYTVTLNTSYSGKSYFLISNNDNAKVAASVIRYNGHNGSIDEHKLNSFYCYHLICMAGAYYVIGQCDW